MDHISADKLFFDLKNPRLLQFNLQHADDTQILNVLWREMAVKDIVMSIQANGFFETEPLLAIEEGNKVIVVEGNRRLAAVKAILHPDLIKNGGMADYKSKTTNSLKEQLSSSIPVIFIKTRAETWQYIGYKHVKGAAKWDSLAKAEYISTVHNEYKVPLDTIANQIGDSNNIVKKLYQGLMVLKQADRETDFKIDDVYNNRLYFSHVYTAIGYSGYQQYLGLDSENFTQDQVPKSKLKNLERVMLWILGSKRMDIRPVIQSQNPDLRHLDAVLSSHEAIQVLCTTKNLDEAYDNSQNGCDLLISFITEAQMNLEKALSKMTFYDGADRTILEASIHLANNADALYKGLKDIYNRHKGIDVTKRSVD